MTVGLGRGSKPPLPFIWLRLVLCLHHAFVLPSQSVFKTINSKFTTTRPCMRAGCRCRCWLDTGTIVHTQVAGNFLEPGVGERGRGSQVELAQAATLASIGCPIGAATLALFLAQGDKAVDVALAGIEQGIGERDVGRRLQPGKPLR
jgi:hypothetical protein